MREGIARLDAMNDAIVPELAWQMGRPVRYGGEMGGVRERTAYMAGIAESALAPTVIEDSDRFRRYLAREPLGLVYVVAPWNYPFLTAINTIVPALIAGNAVVLKHASQTPLAGERLAQAFANLPEGLFSNLFVTHETSSGLLRERAFDFVNFTGSVRGGQEIERAAAGTFVGVGLELGGKDPGYVRADADLGAAVETLVDGAIYNSGQCCCGIERIYVQASLFDEFVERATALVSAYRLGNPLDQETTLGPMAQQTLRRRGARADRRCACRGRDGACRSEALSRRHRRDRLSRAADPDRRRSLDGGDDRGELRPGGRHHVRAGRRRGDRADERLPLRPDRLDLDARCGRRRRDRPAHRDRHDLHEPL